MTLLHVETNPVVTNKDDGLAVDHLGNESRRRVRSWRDVQAASIKRVASAVGEGAMAVKFVHEYLKAR